MSALERVAKRPELLDSIRSFLQPFELERVVEQPELLDSIRSFLQPGAQQGGGLGLQATGKDILRAVEKGVQLLPVVTRDLAIAIPWTAAEWAELRRQQAIVSAPGYIRTTP